MRRGPAPLALIVYGALAALTLGVAIARDESPIETDAWLELPGGARHGLSVLVGAVLALLTVWATRLFVAHWGWAKLLHADLRPAVRGASDATLLLLGSASGIAEELFFRGLLTPALGLVLASLAFGMLHQLRGRAGWIWATWATVMGLLFGTLFLATGSLLGPIVAHVVINVTNLRFLRDTDVAPKKRRHLGGLLGDA
ncbi:MAG TPA: CPBP family intramembrane glutamic endopeptidase [Labilithrix sp.]|nr:CPBP family intramembrane glutamic endopeptidase [Labilithrix sp.]